MAQPTLGATPCSRWSELLARMISMRRTYYRQRLQKPKQTVHPGIKKTISMAAKGNQFDRVQVATASRRGQLP